METWTLIFSIISIIMSIFALALGAYAAIIVVGLRNSTHRIEWRPVESPFTNSEEDVEEFHEDPIKDL